jgi:ribosomal protein S16
MTKYPGGPVIGEATLTYNPVTKSLDASFRIDDEKVADWLKGPPPSIS